MKVRPQELGVFAKIINTLLLQQYREECVWDVRDAALALPPFPLSYKHTPPLAYIAPVKAKLKALATHVHIQLKAPLCGGGGTAAETPACLFGAVVSSLSENYTKAIITIYFSETHV